MPSSNDYATSTVGRTIVIAARHGERQDYLCLMKGENWVSTSDRPWDPPLSDLGWKQGAALGERINQCIADLDLPRLSQVYSSPFQRTQETAVAANATFEDAPHVKLEYGLAELLSEPWFRSWSLPTSNGAWGYHERDQSGAVLPVNLDTLHRAALHPASSIIVPPHPPIEGIDANHRSSTKLHKVYCWGSFESIRDQRVRIESAARTLAKVGETVLLVSHGGPVTLLYEALTGEKWWVHGEASYASFTIYELTPEGKWVTLILNEHEHVPN